MTVEKRKELMNQITLMEGYMERITDSVTPNLTERKANIVAERIWKKRLQILTVAASICFCFAFLLGNETVQANVEQWLNGFVVRMDENYNRNIQEYEEEMNLKASAEGYTLHVYKMAQTATTLVVEYEITDPFGTVVEPISLLWSGGLEAPFSNAFIFSSHAEPLPNDLETGHSRMLYFYDDPVIDFTELEGVKQNITFHFSMGDKEVYVPMEFVLDDIYPAREIVIGKNLEVNGHHIYVDKLVDEGLFLRMIYRQTGKENYEDWDQLELQASCEGQSLEAVYGRGCYENPDSSGDEEWNMYYQWEDIAGKELTFTAVYRDTYLEWVDDSRESGYVTKTMEIVGDCIKVDSLGELNRK